MSQVKIALIQSKSGPDPEMNLEKTWHLAGKAAAGGAKIICLQELYRSRYFCQEHRHDAFDLAETIPGPSTETFAKLAREKSVVLIVPVFEKRAEGIYHNSAAVIDAGGKMLGTYRKMHIPDDPHFYEKFYFTPGDLGFKTFITAYAKISVLICWDQWFPEAARLAALGGAQIIFYPTAIGWHDDETPQARDAQLTAWRTVQCGHAAANEVYVAAVNRSGKEGPVTFWGRSFICDPFGTVMAEAGENEETVLTAVCDLDKIEETRRQWPFFRDRRPDFYQGLTERCLDETPLK
ncbi:MAG: acyltransferase [Omnitrophica bacterium GWA2_52_8]|nr:MAG: acyltransferase [Omnitrophica bacterium GWA2_52_8]